MTKTILLTGATDGIGLETAKKLAADGHHLLLHGRNPDKLAKVKQQLQELAPSAKLETLQADLSSLAAVPDLVEQVKARVDSLDVLINNAGVYNAPAAITADGLDIRFAVNTYAPYMLSKGLLPLMHDLSRVVNLSSAAQSPVDLGALAGQRQLSDGAAYAQSKLAITMWTRIMASAYPAGPLFVAVNPASLLGSKMVKDAYGIPGGDLSIGADILCRAALSEEFANASGLYFDNDIGQFASPHPDALDNPKATEVVNTMEATLAQLGA